jgi:2,4-dienoyl-CoA reductase-like NADH-dependent reductase (Old Yellow Enzyme family)
VSTPDGTSKQKPGIDENPFRQRIVRSATWERKADETGHMTRELSKVYEELAQGGIGMIITGYAFVRTRVQK